MLYDSMDSSPDSRGNEDSRGGINTLTYAG
jgi:hypothetical protein